jgi:Na+/H+ antiporter NhaC
MVNTIIQGARTPFTATLDGLKIEAENEKLNDLTEIGSVVIMIIIILVFHILFLIAKWVHKTQALERLINEIRKILRYKEI